MRIEKIGNWKSAIVAMVLAVVIIAVSNHRLETGATRAGATWAAETLDANEQRLIDVRPVASPVDDGWYIVVLDGTAATAGPYNPASVDPTLWFSLRGYSGFVVRARYPRAQTLTTDPVVRCWIKKGATWSGALTVAGAGDVTLADDATNDCDDAATYKWTIPSGAVDALGARWGAVTVKTAAVTSAGGAVTIEVTRF